MQHRGLTDSDGDESSPNATRWARVHNRANSIMDTGRKWKAKLLAGATGLEPAASCVTGRRSNQLNYAPAFQTKLLPY